jgi:predicted DNA-binding transcriptional regulator AlpA
MANLKQRPARVPERILTLKQFCVLNTIGVTTAKRWINAGQGPRIIDLGPRRIGIRESDAAAWQAARVRDSA